MTNDVCIMVVVSRGEMEGQRFRIDVRNKRTIVIMKVMYYYFPPVALFYNKVSTSEKRTQVAKLMYFYPLFTLNISSLGIRAHRNLISYHGNALNIRTKESKHHDCHFTSLRPQFQYFMSYFVIALRITSNDSEVHDCHFGLHSFRLVQRQTLDP